MSKKITYEQLVNHDTCKDYLEKFKELFGKEVILTKKIVEKHYRYFDVEWAAKNLLSKSARDEYYKITNPARDEYYKITKSASDEYDKITKSASDEYDKDEYDKITKSARDEYDKKCWLDFYKLYKGE